MKLLKRDIDTGNACRLLPPLSIFCLFIFLGACQEPTEGCLDIRAVNFNVAADKDCQTTSCQCIYPNLVASLSYLGGTKNLSFDSTYSLNGQKIRFIQAQMYLSGFQLVRNDNTVAKAIDSFDLARATDTIRLLNDYALVGKNIGFDFKIGAFNAIGQFAKLRFRIGLDALAQTADPRKMPTSHPLSIRADSMYITAEKKYIAHKVIIAKGVDFKDTLRLTITDTTALELTKPLQITEGFDVRLLLKIDYLKFFEGVNFSDSENLIRSKIVSNSKNAFQ
jgi:hypothetical protein